MDFGTVSMAVGERIGDLVLDHLRRLPGIFRVDDHLRVGEIGDGVERQMDQRVDAGRGGEAGTEQHQEQVARRPGDDAGDHGRVSLPDGCLDCVPSASANPLSAAFRLLSASIRKLAEVTTASPSVTPSRDLDIAAAAAAELDLARFEAAVALVDQDGLARAAVEHGAFGHREHRVRRAGLDLRIDVHLGPQQFVGIRQFDADAGRAGLGHQMRIDQRLLSPVKVWPPSPRGLIVTFVPTAI